MEKSEFRRTADMIIEILGYYNIDCYLWSEAKSTGSCYIRFQDPRVGSIRISDHDGKKHFNYKYNVRFDIRHEKTIFKNGSHLFFFPSFRIDSMVFLIIKNYNKIQQENKPARYQYIIPNHKKKKK